jgi:hypothetical protein
MKELLTFCALVALLAGCASDDPYADRGASTVPVGVQSGNVDWGTPPEQELPHLRGSTPGTHPSDPRGGTGADDFGGTDHGQRSPQ